ncbi:MAG: 4Fe-4S dicluster domain-containing protein [Chloroflexi bacterium]|nr:4Fe-4S dicluster domain-containing protein [Chloroflexota bacterium]
MGFIQLVLKPLVRGRATVRYPGAPTDSVTTRRVPRFQPELCIDDRACAAICPTDAITISPAGGGGRRWALDYGRCIFCAECIRVCPPLAIAATGDFELAARGRAGVIAEFLLGEPRDGR